MGGKEASRAEKSKKEQTLGRPEMEIEPPRDGAMGGRARPKPRVAPAANAPG